MFDGPRLYQILQLTALLPCVNLDDVRLTTSNTQVLHGLVTRYTCAAPSSTDPSFMWYVDNEFIPREHSSMLQPIRVRDRRVERNLPTVDGTIAYSVLEIQERRPRSGVVTCLVIIKGTSLMLKSSYVVTDEDDFLHLSYNSSCSQDVACVDGNSSCYVDLRTQVAKCQCKRGYRYSQPRAQCNPNNGGLGSYCEYDEECMELDENAYCEYRRCACKPSYSSQYRIGKCVKEVNLKGSCDSETICLVQHSHCFNRTCQCYKGYEHNVSDSKCVFIVEVGGATFKWFFFTALAIFCFLTILTMVTMAMIRAVFRLMPLRHGARRRRQIMIRLL